MLQATAGMRVSGSTGADTNIMGVNSESTSGKSTHSQGRKRSKSRARPAGWNEIQMGDALNVAQ